MKREPQPQAARPQVRLNGETYTWTGHNWHDSRYLAPPTTVVRQLNLLLEGALATDDDRTTDTHELMRRARAARENLQYDRAEGLARRIIALEPGNNAGAAMLCACLRARGRPREALEETERFLPTTNTALLTSRAAAHCDMGQWPAAKRAVAQALAIQTSEEAFLVVKRIKQAHPELYR